MRGATAPQPAQTRNKDQQSREKPQYLRGGKRRSFARQSAISWDTVGVRAIARVIHSQG
jgi:hypothetical protein